MSEKEYSLNKQREYEELALRLLAKNDFKKVEVSKEFEADEFGITDLLMFPIYLQKSNIVKCTFIDERITAKNYSFKRMFLEKIGG